MKDRAANNQAHVANGLQADGSRIAEMSARTLRFSAIPDAVAELGRSACRI